MVLDKKIVVANADGTGKKTLVFNESMLWIVLDRQTPGFIESRLKIVLDRKTLVFTASLM